MTTPITGQGLNVCIPPDDELSLTSKKAAQNKVITEELTDLSNAISQLDASLAPVETTNTASQAYAVGDLLMYQNRLYKVTSQIVEGGTLIVGTNIVEATVGAELEDVKSVLATKSSLIPFPFADLLDDETRVYSSEGRKITIKGQHIETSRNYGSSTTVVYSFSEKAFFVGSNAFTGSEHTNFIRVDTGLKIAVKCLVYSDLSASNLVIGVAEYDSNYEYVKKTERNFATSGALTITLTEPYALLYICSKSSNTATVTADFWFDIAP